MTTVSIQQGLVHLQLSTLHKVLAMKASLDIPLDSIESVELAGEIARSGPDGIRNPGTSIPHLLNAGSFNSGVKRTFWDVHNPDHAIRIKLKSGMFASIEDRYDEVIVEVADPAEALRNIEAAFNISKQ